MDLIKTGKYITGKRKTLGLTQKQLAEQLGMSDKSISKWERGVCLPDVSVYIELCKILGISINEFLAGEDINKENIFVQSEDNLIQIATESKHRQNHLKIVIAVLIAVAILTISILGVTVYCSVRPQNYITSIKKDSAEMKTAELLSGIDGVFVYKFTTTDSFKSLTLYISEYQSGKLVYKEKMCTSYDDIGSPTSGMIVIAPDYENFTVKLIVADDGSKLSTKLPILDDVKDREFYGRTSTQIGSEIAVKYNEEQGLLGLSYGNGIIHAGCIQDFENGNMPSENDFLYYFSLQFDK